MATISYSDDGGDSMEVDDPNPELPQRFREVIFDELHSFGLELIFEKRLQPSDVNPPQDHFCISQSAAARNLFTPSEQHRLARGGLRVKVIGPNVQVITMELKIMNMCGSSAFVFGCNDWYNGIVVPGGLREGDAIQVWLFRDSGSGQPCFAFVSPRLLFRSNVVRIGDLIRSVSSLGLN